ncbi:unnamed protein product [Rotaria sordida]|uniref:Uncharacterized protein n=1 Tax=Rotaria sordida TaxID=392033 RepID=A0A815L264_9BILA|nr:unnamed protein product [Rotaria sordida]
MGSKSSKRTTLPPPPPFLPPPPPPPPIYPDPFTTSDDPLSRRCRRKPLRPKIRAIFVPQVPTCPCPLPICVPQPMAMPCTCLSNKIPIEF